MGFAQTQKSEENRDAYIYVHILKPSVENSEKLQGFSQLF